MYLYGLMLEHTMDFIQQLGPQRKDGDGNNVSNTGSKWGSHVVRIQLKLLGYKYDCYQYKICKQIKF